MVLGLTGTFMVLEAVGGWLSGSLALLGPSTRAALQRLQDGMPPEEAGRFGATNGAAMRIAPVGIAVPVEPLGEFVDAVAQVSTLTHNTGIGIASAAAVGAAVSAGIDGADTPEALELAVAAACRTRSTS